MATSSSVKTKIQELINKANDTTGENDVELTSAVNRLAEGYSGGDTPSGLAAFLSGETDELNAPELTAVREKGFYYTLATTVVLPNVKRIESQGFMYSSLTSIDLPSLESVSSMVFRDCDSLKSVTLGDNFDFSGTKNTEWEMFYSCDALEYVKLPAKMKILGKETFCGCSKLAEIELPPTLETIGASCFYSTALVHVKIPSTIKKLENYAFNTTLKSIDFSSVTAVPTLDNKEAVGSNSIIIVPASLYANFSWTTNWSKIYSRIVPAIGYQYRGSKIYFYWRKAMSAGHCFYAKENDYPTQERLDAIVPNLTLHWGYSVGFNPDSITQPHIGASIDGVAFEESADCYCFIGYTTDSASAENIREQLNRSGLFLSAYRDEVLW